MDAGVDQGRLGAVRWRSAVRWGDRDGYRLGSLCIIGWKAEL